MPISLSQYRAIQPDTVLAWLHQHGWSKVEALKDVVSLWTVERQAQVHKVLVPLNPEMPDYPNRVKETLETVAAVESMDERVLLALWQGVSLPSQLPFECFVGKTVATVERLYVDRSIAHQNTGELYLFKFTDGTETVVSVGVETGAGFASAVGYPTFQAAMQAEMPCTIYSSLPIPEAKQATVNALLATKRYLITVQWFRTFQRQIQAHETATCPADVDARLWESVRQGLIAKLQDLEKEAAQYESDCAGNEPLCPCCREFMQPRRYLDFEAAAAMPSGIWVCEECQTATGEPFHESFTPSQLD